MKKTNKTKNKFSSFEVINITEEQFHKIIEFAKSAPDDIKVETLGLLYLAEQAHNTIFQKNMTIKKLKTILFPKTEKLKNVAKNKDNKANTRANKGSQTDTDKKKKKGHGKNPIDKFKNAENIFHPLNNMKPGDKCPFCDKGKGYPIKNKKIIRIMGSHLLKANIHEIENLRCNACGMIFSAELPENISKERTDETANAIVALNKYAAGLPFYRFEKLNKMLGIPISRSTLWEMCEKVADKIYPIYNKLLKYAEQSELIYIDDTRVKILNTQSSNNEKRRKGTYTTGVVAKIYDHEINLFFSGKKHAGENLYTVLEDRCNSLSPPIVMADAASQNFSKVSNIIPANCNVHARRKIIDNYEKFPVECNYILELYADIFKNEKYCKQNGLTDKKRLKYHQAHSKNKMNKIKKFIEEQFYKNKTEENSTLGIAFKYILRHWKKLTRFLEVKGCPLENNTAERLLKKAIVNRKNAMFYKNEHGALIGDILMSVIFTAEKAGVNPFDYLVTLQKNKSLVHKEPENWLPWNYIYTLNSLDNFKSVA